MSPSEHADAVAEDLGLPRQLESEGVVLAPSKTNPQPKEQDQ